MTLRRLRYHLWGLVLVPLAVVLVPLIGARIAYETWARALAWPVPPRGSWIRIWWWYGYHGLYQIDWWMKRKTVVA